MSKHIPWICIVIMALATLVIPVAAVNVTSWPDGANVTLDNWTIVPQHSNVGGSDAIIQDSIVLNAPNRQNDLLAELVKAQWVETCYAPKFKGSGSYVNPDAYSNLSVWKQECANAGYPV